MKRSGMIRQPIRNGMRQPHTTISSGGTSALKSTPRSATKMTATCWLPDCQLTHSSHRHEQHADNDNRPVLAESQQNFSWRGMVRSLASLLKFFGFLERITQYEKKRNDQQPIRNGMRQPHTTISSGGTSALKSTPRSATKMTATCWLPDCQLTYSSHRHEQHADNDNRPVLAESQQNFSWRGM